MDLRVVSCWVACVAVGAVGWGLSSPRGDPETHADLHPPPAATAMAVAAATPHPRFAHTVATTPHRTDASLAHTFDQATDLRSFAMAAREHARSGGYFYAARALAECRLRPVEEWNEAAEVEGSLDRANERANGSASPSTHRRLQARTAQQERWARRCASFLPQELSDDAVAALWRDAARAGDPLAALMQRWRRTVLADDPEGLRRLWQSIVATKDAALLDWAVIQADGLLGITVRSADPAGGDTRRVDRQQMWAAVSCELGAGCKAPHGPPDELCETLPRCSQERWGAGTWPLAPGRDVALTVVAVQRLVRTLRRGEAPLMGAVALTPF